jgi:mRNA-degrading endonuclease RelE of RelBE toxin-antitoxin system
MAYHIQFSDSAIRHLRRFSATQRSTIPEAIERQLVYEPFVETRNKKLLRPNRLFTWELRIGELRAFYEEDEDDAAQVNILAIG